MYPFVEITLNQDIEEVTITDKSKESHTFNIKEELNINEFNVYREFLAQPGKYAYWTSVLSTLKYYLESAELSMEKQRATIYEPSRQTLITVKAVPKPTKDQIEAEIQLDETYQQLQRDVVAYKALVDKVNYIVRAFEQRKDMLIQVGAELRRNKEYERQTNPIGTNAIKQ